MSHKNLRGGREGRLIVPSGWRGDPNGADAGITRSLACFHVEIGRRAHKERSSVRAPECTRENTYARGDLVRYFASLEDPQQPVTFDVSDPQAALGVEAGTVGRHIDLTHRFLGEACRGQGTEFRPYAAVGEIAVIGDVEGGGFHAEVRSILPSGKHAEGVEVREPNASPVPARPLREGEAADPQHRRARIEDGV
jgi:hypothetical protein